MRHIAKLALGALLACAVTAVPLQAQAALGWSTQFVDFGTVTIGSTTVRTLTLTNSDVADPITIEQIDVPFNQGMAFGWSVPGGLPAIIPPGGSLDITLTFTPLDPWGSFYMGDMWITNSSTNMSNLYVQLMGDSIPGGDPCEPLANCGGYCVDTSSAVDHCGSCWNACVAPDNGAATCEAGGCGFVCDEGYEAVGDECLPVVVEDDLLAMIGDIIDFFDDSRAEGTLVGLGPGASAEHRADAMGNMLDEAEALIAAEEWDEACGQLQAVYLRTDNSFPPPDFVAGENTYELADMLWALGEAMECPVTQASCSAVPGRPAAPSLLVFGVLGLALARLRRR